MALNGLLLRLYSPVMKGSEHKSSAVEEKLPVPWMEGAGEGLAALPKEPICFCAFLQAGLAGNWSQYALLVLSRTQSASLLMPGPTGLRRRLEWIGRMTARSAAGSAKNESGARRLSRLISRRLVHRLLRSTGIENDIDALFFRTADEDDFHAELLSQGPPQPKRDEDGLRATVLVLVIFLILVRHSFLNPDVAEAEEARCGVSEGLLRPITPAKSRGNSPDADAIEAWWRVGNGVIHACYGGWHQLPVPAARKAALGDPGEVVSPGEKLPSHYAFTRRAKETFAVMVTGFWRAPLIGRLVRGRARLPA